MFRVGPLTALLWKHGVVRYRRWILTLLEVILPLLPLIGFLYFFNKIGGDSKKMAPTIHHTDPVTVHNIMLEESFYLDQLFYAPNDSLFARDLMDRTSQQLHSKSHAEGFSSERDLLLSKGKHLQHSSNSMAVIFHGLSGDDVPDQLTYTIRDSRKYSTDQIMPSFWFPGPHYHYAFIYNSFVILKLHIDSMFINMKSNGNEDFVNNMQFQEFPYPAYESDTMWYMKFVALTPTVIQLGFMVPLLLIIARVLSDKASGIKELMKMMGVQLRVIWLSHYINCWVAMIPVTIVILVLLVGVPVGNTSTPLVPLSSVLIVYISILLYTNYVILFAFLIVTIFTKALVGCICGATVWIVSMSVTISHIKEASTLLTVAFLFLPNYPLYGMFYAIGLEEVRDQGMHWSTLFSKSSEYPLSLGALWLILLALEALIVVLIWYLDQVNPGPYGIGKPYMFPFKHVMKKIAPHHPIDQFVEVGDVGVECHLETPPIDAVVGIEISNVWKVYEGRGKGKKAALKGVSMNLYTGGITVLLGHNGAGKTTLMSIITGLTNASAGYVHIKGEDGIGLCPQHNLTFPDLTLHQHLLLFGLLKGLTIEQSDKEAKDVAESLQLTEKLNWLCGMLSGGQKRRAQLGLALVGHPKTLILDEPTTGLDPVSRRQMWDILLDMKNRHTILITSHSMEEADILADRVAILDQGRLKCVGSPIFLKKTFSTGYTVRVLTHAGIDTHREIAQVIQHSGAEIEELPREGMLLSYRLLSHQTHHLPILFDALERNKQALNISSIGLSLTTLEEVFLRVTVGSIALPDTTPTTIIDVEEGTEKYLTGCSLFCSRFYALFLKKLYYFASIKKTLILEVLLAILMFTSPLFGEETEEYKDDVPLAMTPNIYPWNLHVFNNVSDHFKSGLMSLGSYYNLHLQETTDVYKSILNEGEKDPKYSYTGNIQMALSSSKSKLCGFYSTSVHHTFPVVAGVMSNLLAASSNLPGAPPHIVTTNHPITTQTIVINDTIEISEFETINWVSSTVFGFFFLLGGFLSLPVRERVGGQRHLQQLAGPKPWLYWLITLITDLTLVLPIAMFLFLITTGFNSAPPLSLHYIFGPVVTLSILHVVASLCFIYLLSFFINSPAGSYITYLIVTSFIGVLISTGTFYAYQNAETNRSWLDRLACLLVPSYPFSQGLFSVLKTSYENGYCTQQMEKQGRTTPCCEKLDGKCVGLASYFTNPKSGISTYIHYLIGSIILYSCLIMLLEYKVFARVREYLLNSYYEPIQLQTLDEEVLRERKRVQEQVEGRGGEAAQVLVERLYKRYKRHVFSRGHEALKDLSFAVQKGECFGLLGANGAGKSTTFNILAGLQVPTKGRCFYKGKTEVSLGYCPQFDALDKFLTGRQVLELFCRLRGVPTGMVSSKVSNMLQSAGLTEYSGVRCGLYSGGTRRRLSAVVGLGAAHRGGDCVLLDEPSAGVDPHSRQSLHNLIQEARSKGYCIVLSSHSMEECDKLVSRLGILRRGELACLGMPQHLKHKFSSGYLLTLRLRPHPVPAASQDVLDSPTDNLTQLVSVQPSHDIAQLRQAVTDRFSCTLKDEHLTVLQYHIEDRNCAYSTMFTNMEELKSRYGSVLEDYTISDTTLEQVFLSLTREGDDSLQ